MESLQNFVISTWYSLSWWIKGIPAAGWAAVAAIFSALSSFMLVRIHARNQREANRPELVLTNWSRADDPEKGTTNIHARSVLNVGRGHANGVLINCSRRAGGKNSRPVVIRGTTFIDFISKDGSSSLHDRILIWWKNVDSPKGSIKAVGFKLHMTCTDNHRNKYHTQYQFAVLKDDVPIAGANMIAPGATVQRTVRFIPRWKTRLAHRFRRVPLLGRLLQRNL